MTPREDVLEAALQEVLPWVERRQNEHCAAYGIRSPKLDGLMGVIYNALHPAQIEETHAHQLTSRERSCLLWAARGKTYTETGMILGISFQTVKRHLDTARYKLNCASLAQATAAAAAEGMFTLEDLKGR